jgi:hypothetical protein
MQGHYSEVHLKVEWVYSSDMVTSVVDNASWFTPCTRLPLLFIASVQSQGVPSDKPAYSSFILMI